MAMRIVKNPGRTTLAEELKLLKEAEEAEPIVITVEIERYVATVKGDKIYTFNSTWTVTESNNHEVDETHVSWYYDGNNFRKLMHRELEYIRDYVKRAKKKTSCVEVRLVRTYTNFAA